MIIVYIYLCFKVYSISDYSLVDGYGSLVFLFMIDFILNSFLIGKNEERKVVVIDKISFLKSFLKLIELLSRGGKMFFKRS